MTVRLDRPAHHPPISTHEPAAHTRTSAPTTSSNSAPLDSADSTDTRSNEAPRSEGAQGALASPEQAKAQEKDRDTTARAFAAGGNPIDAALKDGVADDGHLSDKAKKSFATLAAGGEDAVEKLLAGLHIYLPAGTPKSGLAKRLGYSQPNANQNLANDLKRLLQDGKMSERLLALRQLAEKPASGAARQPFIDALYFCNALYVLAKGEIRAQEKKPHTMLQQAHHDHIAARKAALEAWQSPLAQAQKADTQQWIRQTAAQAAHAQNIAQDPTRSLNDRAAAAQHAAEAQKTLGETYVRLADYAEKEKKTARAKENRLNAVGHFSLQGTLQSQRAELADEKFSAAKLEGFHAANAQVEKLPDDEDRENALSGLKRARAGAAQLELAVRGVPGLMQRSKDAAALGNARALAALDPEGTDPSKPFKAAEAAKAQDARIKQAELAEATKQAKAQSDLLARMPPEERASLKQLSEHVSSLQAEALGHTERAIALVKQQRAAAPPSAQAALTHRLEVLEIEHAAIAKEGRDFANVRVGAAQTQEVQVASSGVAEIPDEASADSALEFALLTAEGAELNKWNAAAKAAQIKGHDNSYSITFRALGVLHSWASDEERSQPKARAALRIAVRNKVAQMLQAGKTPEQINDALAKKGLPKEMISAAQSDAVRRDLRTQGLHIESPAHGFTASGVADLQLQNARDQLAMAEVDLEAAQDFKTPFAINALKVKNAQAKVEAAKKGVDAAKHRAAADVSAEPRATILGASESELKKWQGHLFTSATNLNALSNEAVARKDYGASRALATHSGVALKSHAEVVNQQERHHSVMRSALQSRAVQHREAAQADDAEFSSERVGLSIDDALSGESQLHLMAGLVGKDLPENVSRLAAHHPVRWLLDTDLKERQFHATVGRRDGRLEIANACDSATVQHDNALRESDAQRASAETLAKGIALNLQAGLVDPHLTGAERSATTLLAVDAWHTASVFAAEASHPTASRDATSTSEVLTKQLSAADQTKASALHRTATRQVTSALASRAGRSDQVSNGDIARAYESHLASRASGSPLSPEEAALDELAKWNPEKDLAERLDQSGKEAKAKLADDKLELDIEEDGLVHILFKVNGTMQMLLKERRKRQEETLRHDQAGIDETVAREREVLRQLGADIAAQPSAGLRLAHAAELIHAIGFGTDGMMAGQRQDNIRMLRNLDQPLTFALQQRWHDGEAIRPLLQAANQGAGPDTLAKQSQRFQKDLEQVRQWAPVVTGAQELAIAIVTAVVSAGVGGAAAEGASISARMAASMGVGPGLTLQGIRVSVSVAHAMTTMFIQNLGSAIARRALGSSDVMAEAIGAALQFFTLGSTNAIGDFAGLENALVPVGSTFANLLIGNRIVNPNKKEGFELATTAVMTLYPAIHSAVKQAHHDALTRTTQPEVAIANLQHQLTELKVDPKLCQQQLHLLAQTILMHDMQRQKLQINEHSLPAYAHLAEALAAKTHGAVNAQALISDATAAVHGLQSVQAKPLAEARITAMPEAQAQQKHLIEGMQRARKEGQIILGNDGVANTGPEYFFHGDEGTLPTSNLWPNAIVVDATTGKARPGFVKSGPFAGLNEILVQGDDGLLHTEKVSREQLTPVAKNLDQRPIPAESGRGAQIETAYVLGQTDKHSVIWDRQKKQFRIADHNEFHPTAAGQSVVGLHGGELHQQLEHLRTHVEELEHRMSGEERRALRQEFTRALAQQALVSGGRTYTEAERAASWPHFLRDKVDTLLRHAASPNEQEALMRVLTVHGSFAAVERFQRAVEAYFAPELPTRAAYARLTSAEGLSQIFTESCPLTVVQKQRALMSPLAAIEYVAMGREGLAKEQERMAKAIGGAVGKVRDNVASPGQGLARQAKPDVVESELVGQGSGLVALPTSMNAELGSLTGHRYSVVSRGTEHTHKSLSAITETLWQSLAAKPKEGVSVALMRDGENFGHITLVMEAKLTRNADGVEQRTFNIWDPHTSQPIWVTEKDLTNPAGNPALAGKPSLRAIYPREHEAVVTLLNRLKDKTAAKPFGDLLASLTIGVANKDPAALRAHETALSLAALSPPEFAAFAVDMFARAREELTARGVAVPMELFRSDKQLNELRTVFAEKQAAPTSKPAREPRQTPPLVPLESAGKGYDTHLPVKLDAAGVPSLQPSHANPIEARLALLKQTQPVHAAMAQELVSKMQAARAESDLQLGVSGTNHQAPAILYPGDQGTIPAFNHWPNLVIRGADGQTHLGYSSGGFLSASMTVHVLNADGSITPTQVRPEHVTLIERNPGEQPIAAESGRSGTRETGYILGRSDQHTLVWDRQRRIFRLTEPEAFHLATPGQPVVDQIGSVLHQRMEALRDNPLSLLSRASLEERRALNEEFASSPHGLPSNADPMKMSEAKIRFLRRKVDSMLSSARSPAEQRALMQVLTVHGSLAAVERFQLAMSAYFAPQQPTKEAYARLTTADGLAQIFHGSCALANLQKVRAHLSPLHAIEYVAMGRLGLAADQNRLAQKGNGLGPIHEEVPAPGMGPKRRAFSTDGSLAGQSNDGSSLSHVEQMLNAEIGPTVGSRFVADKGSFPMSSLRRIGLMERLFELTRSPESFPAEGIWLQARAVDGRPLGHAMAVLDAQLETKPNGATERQYLLYDSGSGTSAWRAERDMFNPRGGDLISGPGIIAGFVLREHPAVSGFAERFNKPTKAVQALAKMLAEADIMVAAKDPQASAFHQELLRLADLSSPELAAAQIEAFQYLDGMHRHLSHPTAPEVMKSLDNPRLSRETVPLATFAIQDVGTVMLKDVKKATRVPSSFVVDTLHEVAAGRILPEEMAPLASFIMSDHLSPKERAEFEKAYMDESNRQHLIEGLLVRMRAQAPELMATSPERHTSTTKTMLDAVYKRFDEKPALGEQATSDDHALLAPIKLALGDDALVRKYFSDLDTAVNKTMMEQRGRNPAPPPGKARHTAALTVLANQMMDVGLLDGTNRPATLKRIVRSDEFMKMLREQGVFFDQGFAGNDHGSLTHIVQLLIVAKALPTLSTTHPHLQIRTVRDFVKRIGESPNGAKIWLEGFDTFQPGPHSPETLGPVVDHIAGTLNFSRMRSLTAARNVVRVAETRAMISHELKMCEQELGEAYSRPGLRTLLLLSGTSQLARGDAASFAKLLETSLTRDQVPAAIASVIAAKVKNAVSANEQSRDTAEYKMLLADSTAVESIQFGKRQLSAKFAEDGDVESYAAALRQLYVKNNRLDKASEQYAATLDACVNRALAQSGVVPPALDAHEEAPMTVRTPHVVDVTAAAPPSPGPKSPRPGKTQPMAPLQPVHVADAAPGAERESQQSTNPSSAPNHGKAALDQASKLFDNDVGLAFRFLQRRTELMARIEETPAGMHNTLNELRQELLFLKSLESNRVPKQFAKPAFQCLENGSPGMRQLLEGWMKSKKPLLVTNTQDLAYALAPLANASPALRNRFSFVVLDFIASRASEVGHWQLRGVVEKITRMPQEEFNAWAMSVLHMTPIQNDAEFRKLVDAVSENTPQTPQPKITDPSDDVSAATQKPGVARSADETVRPGHQAQATARPAGAAPKAGAADVGRTVGPAARATVKPERAVANSHAARTKRNVDAALAALPSAAVNRDVMAKELHALARDHRFQSMTSEVQQAVLNAIAMHTDLHTRGQLARIAKHDAVAALTPEEQAKIFTLCQGYDHHISAYARQFFERRAVESGKSAERPLHERTAALREALEHHAWLPGVVPPTPGAVVTRAAYAAPKLLQSAEFEFQNAKDGKKSMGHLYEVVIHGVAKQILMPEKGPGRDLHLATLEQITDALAGLSPDDFAKVSKVVVNAEPNTEDAVWVKQYNDTKFCSAATMRTEDGLLNVYPWTQAVTQAVLDTTFVHEVGHVVSRQAMGPAHQGEGWTMWRDAIATDPSAGSQYARKNPEEDFSETLAFYRQVKGTPQEPSARALMPKRFVILDAMYGPGVKESAQSHLQGYPPIASAHDYTIFAQAQQRLSGDNEAAHAWFKLFNDARTEVQQAKAKQPPVQAEIDAALATQMHVFALRDVKPATRASQNVVIASGFGLAALPLIEKLIQQKGDKARSALGLLKFAANTAREREGPKLRSRLDDQVLAAIFEASSELTSKELSPFIQHLVASDSATFTEWRASLAKAKTPQERLGALLEMSQGIEAFAATVGAPTSSLRRGKPAPSKPAPPQTSPQATAAPAVDMSPITPATIHHVHEGEIETNPNSPYNGKWNGQGCHTWDGMNRVLARDGYQLTKIEEDPTTGARHVYVERAGPDRKGSIIKSMRPKTLYPKRLTKAEIDEAGARAFATARAGDAGSTFYPAIPAAQKVPGGPLEGIFTATVPVGTPAVSMTITGFFEDRNGKLELISHYPKRDPNWPVIAKEKY